LEQQPIRNEVRIDEHYCGTNGISQFISATYHQHLIQFPLFKEVVCSLIEYPFPTHLRILFGIWIMMGKYFLSVSEVELTPGSKFEPQIFEDVTVEELNEEKFCKWFLKKIAIISSEKNYSTKIKFMLMNILDLKVTDNDHHARYNRHSVWSPPNN